MKSAEQILESKFPVGLSAGPSKAFGIGHILFSTSECSAGLSTNWVFYPTFCCLFCSQFISAPAPLSEWLTAVEVYVLQSFPHRSLTIFPPVTKEVCPTTNHISNGAWLCFVFSGKPPLPKGHLGSMDWEGSSGSREHLSRLGKAAASLRLFKELTSGRDSGARLLLMPFQTSRFLFSSMCVWSRKCVIPNSFLLVWSPQTLQAL